MDSKDELGRPPHTLIAELTHACPPRCAHCASLTDFDRAATSLSTSQWLDVIRQGHALGVSQLDLRGSEPLLRQDLEALVAGAARRELQVNLITGGFPLRRERLRALRDAGLGAIRLSFQNVEPEACHAAGGADCLESKRRAARWAVELELPLTLHVVLHRLNIARVSDFVALAHELGAVRLELVNAQYLGFWLRGSDALLPSVEQIERARQVFAEERQRLRGQLELRLVLPDYFSGRPRACMNGWARRDLVVAPDGVVLPCQAARGLPGLEFDSVLARPLADIWRSSAGLRAFRGEAWMSDTCRGCERRTRDFGGCRCQAYALTGDARATDPACALSPDHALIIELTAVPHSGVLTLRRTR